MQKFTTLINAVKQRISFSQMMLTLSIFITAVLMTICVIKTHQQKQALKTLMLSQFSQVNYNLKNLSSQLETKPVATPEQVSVLEKRLDSIQQFLPKLNSSDEIKQLQKLIFANNKAILQKINSMQIQSEVLKKFIKQKYLSISQLPFKVTSIDIWNDRPEVTIYTDEGYHLIGLDDFYLGWTLTDVSFDPAYAVFQNSQKNQIKVRF